MVDVKTFKTITDKETRIHEVEIENDIPKSWNIIYSENVSAPKALMKYYRADEYGYNVLKEGKIWASHPFSFNDPFDCSVQMWDKNNFPKNFAIEHLRNTKAQLKKTRINLQEKDSFNSIERLRKGYLEILLKFIGIFCLNDNKNSELFWGYYNNHEGYSIAFDSDVLSYHWRMKPLKVEYDDVENFQKFSLIEDEVKDSNILPKIVRWASLKKKEWSHENEWRFIFLDIDFLETNRLKKFPANSIIEITLGYKYFIDQEKDFRSYRQTDKIITFEFLPQDNQIKLYILSEIYENGIELYQVELSEDFKLLKRKIEILEIKNNKVTIFYSDITK